MLFGTAGIHIVFGGAAVVGTLGDWWNRLVAKRQVEKFKSSRARSLRAL